MKEPHVQERVVAPDEELPMGGITEVAVQITDGEGSTELIAAQLKRIADAGAALLDGPLTERALILLLRDLCAVRQDEIKRVLHAIPRLREYVERGA